jgi:hypothetical protein
MGSSCIKGSFNTPFGTIACDGCSFSCVQTQSQETAAKAAEKAVVDHTIQMITKLVGSESIQVQNNLGAIVKELLAAGTDPSTIQVEHQVHSPQPGVRTITTRIVHGSTPPESPKQQPLPRNLYEVEEKESETDDPPPLNPPTLIRQDADIPSPPFRTFVHFPSPPPLVRQ